MAMSILGHQRYRVLATGSSIGVPLAVRSSREVDVLRLACTNFVLCFSHARHALGPKPTPVNIQGRTLYLHT